MDIFNFSKTVEQGIYDVMLWVFFFPYTLARIVLLPGRMLLHVEQQFLLEADAAFASSMRPALLLFLSIALGSLLAPLPAGFVEYLRQFHLAAKVMETWLGLLAWRMMVYSFFAIVGALLFDLLTPGPVTRDSLRLPFNQQCYLCAPFALAIVPLLVIDAFSPSLWVDWAVGLVATWFVGAQYLFFRQFTEAGPLRCLGLAASVLAAGVGWIHLTGYVLFAL